MLHEFLLKNRDEILALTEEKSLELAGIRPSSAQLKLGLPLFYSQLLVVLHYHQEIPLAEGTETAETKFAAAVRRESRVVELASGPGDSELTKAGGVHGTELLRLGYTLTHVVHAYGAMCQSITQMASIKNVPITPNEFRDLNRCLDIAIAGAVTAFESHRSTQENSRHVEQFGSLAHELRNALSNANISLLLIKNGTVGFSGSTGRVLERSMLRIGALIDRSLTEVRLSVDPTIYAEKTLLLQLVDQIAVTALVEANLRDQKLEIQIDPALTVEADGQLFLSALSNLIQNALKYTRVGGTIQVRAREVGDSIVVEVEDECGGLSDTKVDLFKPFEQQNENREGLGLGLTIAQRAITLNHGTIAVQNLPKKGCIFRITLPKSVPAKPVSPG